MLSIIVGLVAFVCLGIFISREPVSQTERAIAAVRQPPDIPVLQAEVDACGTLTGATTWSADTTYVANNCDVEVAADATLTIQPGTVVKFGGDSSALIVHGELVVQGNASQPVAITSLHDDAHGGAASGSNGSPAAGDWYGIYIGEGASGSIAHAFIGYGASGVFNINVGLNEGGYSKAHVWVKKGSLAMRSVTLDQGKMDGVYLDGFDITPDIQDVTITNHGGKAIFQTSMNMQPTYGDTTFENNTINAVTIDWDHWNPITRTVRLGGTTFSFSCSFTNCPLNVTSGLTLTIDPGTQLHFEPGPYYFVIAEGAALLAEGTAEQPITFTSRQSEPQPGDWYGIVLEQGATGRFAHCDIGYGGNSHYAAFDVSATDVQMHDCTIHHSNRSGIRLQAADITPAFTNVHVTDNQTYGIEFTGGSSASHIGMVFADGSIQRNVEAGIWMDSWTTSHNPTFRNVLVKDNGGDGLRLESQDATPLLEDVRFVGNSGAAVRWVANTAPTFRNLSATGNGINALVNVGGTITSGREWGLVEANLPVYMVADTTIDSGALLSLQPGTTLLLTPTVSMYSKGSVYAIGTATRPITFTGVTETPGAWDNLSFSGGSASAVLQHCTLEYGGGRNDRMLAFEGDGQYVVQNSRIRYSQGVGLYSSVRNSFLIRNNEIYSNTTYGVRKTYGPELDARSNWWGHASGPYHETLNPEGKGDAVGDYDHVLFDPWLTTLPDETATMDEVIVDTGAPRVISPGESVEYGIKYVNLMAEPVADAVLMMQLPAAANYVESSHGGIFWHERDQVFWRLDTLAPGDNGMVSVRVRFQWGLPADYTDGTITLLAGSTYQQDELDVTPYLDYQPVRLQAPAILSEDDFAAERNANADLKTLYDEALDDNYTYHASGRMQGSDGSSIIQAIMVQNNRTSLRILLLHEGKALAMTFQQDEIRLQDTTGGMRTSLLTEQQHFWGSWDTERSATMLAQAGLTAGCTSGRCKANCLGAMVGAKALAKAGGAILSWTALSFFSGGAATVPGIVWGVGSTGLGIYHCFSDCNQDPNTHCCSGNQVRWSTGAWTSLSGACWKQECNSTTGQYKTSGAIYCPGSERCVAGMDSSGGCKACFEEAGKRTAQKPNCRDLELRRAKDPNALYGPAGDLLPGQVVPYTITYENVGAGRAYGVYVMDELDEVFDASTLQMADTGTYLPEERTLAWMIGELGPQGDADSEGTITFTVRLRDDLTSGTVIRNQATVFFPSVPEETQTNLVINQIQPLAAIPQEVETGYQQPLDITLHGRSVDDLPLSYELVDMPLAGSLTGEPPAVTYTPVEHFIGRDTFRFQVTNGITTSRAATVQVIVHATGDSSPPEIVGSNPLPDTTAVTVTEEPSFQDGYGDVYAPLITLDFSEGLNSETVTAQTVQLQAAGGATVPISVTCSGLPAQAVILPRAPLQPGTTYAVTVDTSVSDMAGNTLSSPYQLAFSTSGASSAKVVYLPLLRK
jgi:hypothetical protein